ncbi:MAG TPA: hypothetical protein VE172_20235 [Stackebrandtia sp.]|jgi:hypothetical protein|uniref:LolA family protein n=1 Tax=Stackebrandtia sp. TaxID=2023065 RepID=UPI002D3C4BBE|nr:hypothetical protein [Stackebrandtia sp.]HZE41135.1 hypothetical protein [Stackebrandtia sp.]
MLRKRTLRRFAIPAAIATGAVTVAGGVGIVLAATAGLPDKSADQVLSDLKSSHVDGFSGNVTQTSDLGLPATDKSKTTSALSSGTHKLSVAYTAEGNRARVAYQGDVAETDYTRDGTDLYRWDSASGEVRHRTLSGPWADTPMLPVSGWNPQGSAEKAAASASGTDLSLEDQVTVAGRDAYMLVMKPKDSSSLIDQVKVAVDGENGMALSTEVYPKGSDSPAFSASFTEVSFDAPSANTYKFHAPKGSKVTEDGRLGDALAAETSAGDVIGGGWGSISHIATTEAEIKKTLVDEGASPEAVQGWIDDAKPVDGGKLLETKVANAYLTDGGELYVGAVDSDALIAAAKG